MKLLTEPIFGNFPFPCSSVTKSFRLRKNQKTPFRSLRPGQHQRPAESVHPLTVLHISDTGLARRQHYKLRSSEIELCGFGGGQNAIIICSRAAGVGAGECEARPQQWILAERHGYWP